MLAAMVFGFIVWLRGFSEIGANVLSYFSLRGCPTLCCLCSVDVIVPWLCRRQPQIAVVGSWHCIASSSGYCGTLVRIFNIDLVCCCLLLFGLVCCCCCCCHWFLVIVGFLLLLVCCYCWFVVVWFAV